MISRLADLQSRYDVIILGAGAAGARLARELTVRGDRTVLLLEAGGAHAGPNSRVPAYYPRAFGGRLDWGYKTIRQSQLGGRRIHLPSGRALGGSTAINAMIWMDPADACLAELQQACGEDWTIEKSRHALSDLRGELEQAQMLSLPELSPNVETLYRVIQPWRIPVGDSMDFPQIGVAPFNRMQRFGRRVSFAALLKSKTNLLTLCTEANVSKLLLQSGSVTGVEVQYENQTVRIETEQVVVCCGAIGTPKVLMASGIGPTAILLDARIPVIHPLEGVGCGLQDHLVFPIVYSLEGGERFSIPMARSMREQYHRERLGPLSSNLSELGGFFQLGIENAGVSECQGKSIDWPNAFQWHITPTDYLRYPKYDTELPRFSVGVTLSKPKSRGAIHLLREEGQQTGFDVRIDPNYLGDTADYNRMLEAIQWTRKAIGDLLGLHKQAAEIFPGDSRKVPQEVGAALRKFATTLYHYSSSCQMGSDPQSPVDSRLRLKGIDGLYVCDASVLPSVPGCNPQALVQMLAKRLATWL
jgi:choline dehydrogenase-like flavoprotein